MPASFDVDDAILPRRPWHRWGAGSPWSGPVRRGILGTIDLPVSVGTLHPSLVYVSVADVSSRQVKHIALPLHLPMVDIFVTYDPLLSRKVGP